MKLLIITSFFLSTLIFAQETPKDGTFECMGKRKHRLCVSNKDSKLTYKECLKICDPNKKLKKDK